MKSFYVTLVALMFHFSCSSSTSDSDLTKEQRAKKALDDFEWTTSIDLYEELIEENPEEYEFYALKATGHCGRAGADVFSIASSKLSSGNVLEKIKTFIPAEPTAEQEADIQEAVSLLQSIPLDSLNSDFRTSVEAQISVYLTINSGMSINKFSKITPTGQLDPEKLAEMTPEDAANILDSISSAAEITDDPKFQEKLDGLLDEIDAEDGATTAEKLQSYLKNNTSS